VGRPSMLVTACEDDLSLLFPPSFPSFRSLLSLLFSFPPSLSPSFPLSLLPSFPTSLLSSFPPSSVPSSVAYRWAFRSIHINGTAAVVIAVYVCLNYWAKWRKLEGKDAQAVRFEVFVGGREVVRMDGRNGGRAMSMHVY